MKHKDRQEIEKMIADAMKGFEGDLAAYINYYNDRLSAVEDKLGIEVEGYHEFLGKSHKGG
jgi:hypothetical protein